MTGLVDAMRAAVQQSRAAPAFVRVSPTVVDAIMAETHGAFQRLYNGWLCRRGSRFFFLPDSYEPATRNPTEEAMRKLTEGVIERVVSALQEGITECTNAWYKDMAAEAHLLLPEDEA